MVINLVKYLQKCLNPLLLLMSLAVFSFIVPVYLLLHASYLQTVSTVATNFNSYTKS